MTNINNNTVNLSKISNNCHSHNPVSLDTYALHDQHGDNSSHNSSSFLSHPEDKRDTVPLCELSPSHTQSAPIPPEGEVPYNSPPLSSSLEEDTSSSIGALSEDELFVREDCGASIPV